MRTMNSPTTTQAVGRRRFGLIAALAAMVLVIATVSGWLLLRSDEKTAADRLQDVTAAMRNDDMTELAEIFGFDDTDSTNYRFLDWHIGWEANPEFTDVVETPGTADRTRFTATVTYDDGSFYSRALNQTLTTTISGYVNEDGTIDVSGWPPPNGLTTVEGELRSWIDASRAELHDELFGSDYSGMRWSRRSGELRMELLEDFLASR